MTNKLSDIRNYRFALSTAVDARCASCRWCRFTSARHGECVRLDIAIENPRTSQCPGYDLDVAHGRRGGE